MPSMLNGTSFDPGSTRLILPSDDHSAMLWDADSGKPASEPVKCNGAVTAAAFSADGKRFLVASADGLLRLGEGASGKLVGNPLKHPAGLSDACFDSTGRRALTVCDDLLLRLWNVEGDTLAAEPMPHKKPIHRACLGLGDKLVLSASDDGLARLWDASTGKLLGQLKHPGAVLDAGFSGDLVWTQCDDATVRAWQPGTNKLVHEKINHPGLLVVAASPNGKLLATAGKDGAVRLWEATTGAQVDAALKTEGAVLALAFGGPQGEWLVAGGEAPVATLWSMAGPPFKAVPLRHGSSVQAVALDPNGQRVLSFGADRAARTWLADGGKPIGQPMRLGADPAATPSTVETQLDNATLTRLGGERVVSVGGIAGIFTPLTSGVDGPLGADERKNLLSIIDTLKREVGEVQSRNLKLEADLAALRQRPSAPEDFATGVQQSLDELQQRMGAMRNATSNFAVREFKLDASVQVQVSPLGSIEYRFVQPGDSVDAQTLSRISMQVVPLPKDNLAGVWTSNLFQPELPLANLPEVTAEAVQRLEAAGLYSIGEFLQTGTRARALAYLEALLGVQRQRLAVWAQQAVLLTLRGMTGPAALVLMDAGCGAFEPLATLPAEALLLRYETARLARPDLPAPALTPALAEQWVRAARQYLGLPEAVAAPAPEPTPAPQPTPAPAPP